MSELLRLREWLSFSDAQRYLSLLGIKAPQKDFFLAYASVHMPMRLDCRASPFFTLSRDTPERGYPHRLFAKEEHGDGYKTDGGSLYPTDSDLMVAGGKVQSGFGEQDFVWVNDPLSFDPMRPDAEPVYCQWDHEGRLIFDLLTWGDLLRSNYAEALQFSRPYIEILVKRAKGEEIPEPATPEPTAPAPISSAPQVPAYLDPSHESYPPELAAAVMLWESLYIRGEKSQHHGHTQAAKLWLEKNRDSLPTAHLSNHGSTAWLERLSSITSPDAKKQKR